MNLRFKKKNYLALMITVLVAIVSSCSLPSEADRLRVENQKKIDAVCYQINNQLNEMIDAGNDLIDYDYIFDQYREYENKYQSVAEELALIDDELKGPSLIVRQVVRDLVEIASSPNSVIESLAVIRVSVNTEKWNRRNSKLEGIMTVMKVLCSEDSTRPKGVTYSTTESCDLNCQFSQKSKVQEVLVPAGSNAKKTQFDSWEYSTTVGSVDEISKYYLTTLGTYGWMMQPGESNFGPKSDAGFLISQVWCRAKPKRINLQVVISSLSANPGTTYITLLTDNDKSLNCD